MKHFLIITLFFLNLIHAEAQSDTLIRKKYKTVYKNNFQTNLLGVIGHPSLQYERALNKDFSLSLIGNYNNPMFSSSFEKYSLHVEGRFYTDKNTILNNGFYLAADIGFNYERYYHSKYIQDVKYTWFGVGLGYQLLAKKRFVIDANIIALLGFKGKYKLSNDAIGWRSLHKFSQSDILGSINIGYAF